MNDFKKEYAALREPMLKAIDECLEYGYYILGPQVKKFEEEFAAYNGSSYCIGVANGLEALQIALMALEIGKGDEVITVSNSAVATVLAITNAGATPVFVDVDEYFHLDVSQLESKITDKTKAIIPVHLFGQMVDMDTIMDVAQKHRLHVIEDACQGHGGMLHGKKAGSVGTFGCFSFYPTKNLGGYGDSGAITTNSKELYEKCLMLRNYGQQTRYVHLLQGMNSRIDELQATILRVKLSQLEKSVNKRNEIAQVYLQELADCSDIILPQVRPDAGHSFHLFVIQTNDRAELQAFLKDHGIESLIHYPIPIHKQACYPEFNAVELPVTEHLAETVLSLPIHPYMELSEAKQVAEMIKLFYREKKH